MVLEQLSCIGIGSMMNYTQIYDQVNIKLLISIFRFCTLPTYINDIFQFATKRRFLKSIHMQPDDKDAHNSKLFWPKLVCSIT